MQKISVKTVAVMGLLCAVVSAGFAWQQRSAAIELSRQIAALGIEIKQKSRIIKDHDELIRQLRQENETYIRESAALRAKLAAQPAAPAVVASASEPAPTSSPAAPFKRDLAKMFDDPKMKKMFRQQHQFQLKQLYSDFIRERRLDSRQSEQFFDLLTDGEINNMEDGLHSLDDNDGGATSNGAWALQAGGFDRQMQSLLGDSNFAAYKSYEQTLGDRMALARVREQISLAGSPLRDDQAKTLLQVMTEERSRSTSSVDPEGPGSYREKLKTLFDPEGGEKYIATKAERNKRVLDRMAGILTPEQYEAFERQQENELEMEKIGIEMSRDLLEREKDEGYSFSAAPR